MSEYTDLSNNDLSLPLLSNDEDPAAKTEEPRSSDRTAKLAATIWTLSALLVLLMMTYCNTWNDLVENAKDVFEDIRSEIRTYHGDENRVSEDYDDSPFDERPIIPYDYDHSSMTEVTASNWDDFHKQDHPTSYAFVNFCASWASWCHRIAPTWEQFEARAKQAGIPVAVGRVDCTKESELCRTERITIFPTLRFYHDGVAIHPDYNSDRTVANLIEYAERTIGIKCDEIKGMSSPVSPYEKKDDEATTEVDVDELEGVDKSDSRDSDDVEHVTVYYAIGDENKEKVSERTYSEKEDDTSKEESEENEDKEKTDDDVVADELEDVDEPTSSRESDDVEEDAVVVYTVVDITLSTWDDFMNAKDMAFVDFFAAWSLGCQRLAPTWETFANEVEREGIPISIGRVNCVTEAVLCRRQQIQRYPSLRWYKSGRLTYPEYTSDRTVDTLMAYTREKVADYEKKNEMDPVVLDSLSASV